MRGDKKNGARIIYVGQGQRWVIGSGRHNKSSLIWIKILALCFFLALSFVLYESGVFHFFMDREKILSFLQSLGPISFIGFIILQFLQVVAAPIPGEVTGFIGGFLYGPLTGLFISTVGLTMGSWAAFALSRALGRPFVEKFVRKETMDKYDYLLHHKGIFLIFLLFLIPGTPKDFLCYLLGLGHLTTKEFLVISTVGRFAGTVLLTLGGNYVRHHQYYRFSVLLAVAVVCIFLSMVYKEKLEALFHRWHKRSTVEQKKNQ